MTAHVLPLPKHWWHCSACDLRDYSEETGVVSRMHPCARLQGVLTPMTEVSGPYAVADTKVAAVEREDYIGDSGGSPLMGTRVEHGSGRQDVNVFAPFATGKGTA